MRPTITSELLAALLETHRSAGAAATVLSFEPADPGAYGRIVRDGDGALQAIVEARDASDEELAIREVNSSIYVFEAAKLWPALERLDPAERPGRALPDRHRARPRRRRRARRRAHGRRRRRGRGREHARRARRRRGRPARPDQPRRTCWPARRSSTRRRPGSTRPSSWSRIARSSPSPSCAAATRVARRRRGRPARGRRRLGDRPRHAGRPLLLPSPRNGAGDGREGGRVRGDQELAHRRTDEGASPVVHRRRGDRRGHEHRGGQHHRQLPPSARPAEGPDEDRPQRQDRSPQCVRRARGDRRRRVDRRGLGDHGGCPGRVARGRAGASRRTRKGACGRKREQERE